MASALRNVGFEVVEGTNLTRDKMTERLLDFGKKAQGADVAVFFYAGHGIAISGTNYLLPIDADIKSEMDVKLGAAINIDLTLDQTMGDAKVKLVFLDACRDNPFAAKIKSNAATRSVNVQTGLAEMKSGEGTLIAFATGPGQTALDGQEGANSPFTRALLANIAQPGVEIQQAMTKVRAQVNEETNKGQLPWGHTNLIGTVYLNGAPAPAHRRGSGRPAVARQRRDRTSNSSSGARSRNPTSRKSSTPIWPAIRTASSGRWRLSRIASLESGAKDANATRNLTTGIDPATFKAEANQTTEDQIGLDKGQRRDVQRRLNGLGFDTKVTGKFDPVDPRRDHALAGRPRLSQERLPQQAAAQGAVDGDRRGCADRKLQRGGAPSRAAAPANRSTSAPRQQPRPASSGDRRLRSQARRWPVRRRVMGGMISRYGLASDDDAQKPGRPGFFIPGRQFQTVGAALDQPDVFVAARGEPAHLDFLARRHRLGAGDLRVIVVFGGRKFARHDAGGIAGERIGHQDAGDLLARQDLH